MMCDLSWNRSSSVQMNKIRVSFISCLVDIEEEGVGVGLGWSGSVKLMKQFIVSSLVIAAQIGTRTRLTPRNLFADILPLFHANYMVSGDYDKQDDNN